MGDTVLKQAAVDNSLSPHGGQLVERLAFLRDGGRDQVLTLPRIEVRDQLAR